VKIVLAEDDKRPRPRPRRKVLCCLLILAIILAIIFGSAALIVVCKMRQLMEFAFIASGNEMYQVKVSDEMMMNICVGPEGEQKVKRVNQFCG